MPEERASSPISSRVSKEIGAGAPRADKSASFELRYSESEVRRESAISESIQSLQDRLIPVVHSPDELEPSGSPPAPQEKAETPWYAWEKIEVAVVFCLFVVLRAMDRVFAKRVSDRMVNYQLFYINIIWPIGVQFMTVLLCCCWVMYHRRQGDLRYNWTFFFPGAAIASAGGAYPQWRLALFSFWDELNAVGTSLPSPFIDLTSQSILTNLVVPFTVVVSLIYLGAQYRQEHYIGCVLVIIASLVTVTVQLQTGQGIGEYKTATGEMVKLHSGATWYIFFIVGMVPAAISNCYKQKCLKGVDLEVMYASLWSGYWQIVWGLLMYPFNWIPLPHPAQKNPVSDTFTGLENAWTCFWGTAPNPNNTQDLSCASPGGCAAVWFAFYLLFNVSFNVLFLWLTKRMSATWAAIATVLCLDLTSIFSMSHLLMGDEAQMITFEQTLGLLIAALAMWVYNLQPELDSSGRPVQGAHVDENATWPDAEEPLAPGIDDPSLRVSFAHVSIASDCASGRSASLVSWAVVGGLPDPEAEKSVRKRGRFGTSPV